MYKYLGRLGNPQSSALQWTKWPSSLHAHHMHIWNQNLCAEDLAMTFLADDFSPPHNYLSAPLCLRVNTGWHLGVKSSTSWVIQRFHSGSEP